MTIARPARFRFPAPDLAPLPGQLLAALGVTLAAAVVLCAWQVPELSTGLGDTDDATRLVLMRDLLNGRGWFDQHVTRFQPPVGVWMHWSRLIDGGLAALDLLFRPFVGPERAEFLVRIVWPLLWIFPATAAALSTAATLAGGGERGERLRAPAVLAACALVLVGIGQLSIQFHPGRVDHHDVQVVFAFLALAGAVRSGPSVRGAVVAGVATGIGLAIGLEALLFEAALAGAMGLRLLADRNEARRVEAYGVSLAAATALAFLAQTPPVRWFAPACDALGWNLLLGAVTGGLLLALAALLTASRSWPWRLLALAVAGAVALAVYLRLDPNCVHGPFADVDPRIRPFWLDHVNEVKPLRQLWRSSKPDATVIAVAGSMALVAWASLGLVAERRRDPAWWTVGLLLLLGAAAAASAVRMRNYPEWFAVAPLAVAAAEAAARLPRLRLAGAVLLGAAFAPVLLGGAVLLATGSLPVRLPPGLSWGLVALLVLSGVALLLRARRLGVRGSAGFAALVLPLAVFVALLLNADRLHAHPRPGAHRRAPEPPDHCFDADSYAPLAALPPGLVVSEVDLGPFVLAHTPSSAMSAPYHRMSWGLLKARGVMVAPADGDAPGSAQARARALGAAYVLECPVHAGHADRDHLAKTSLQARLDDDDAPAWLQEVTDDDADLKVYRIAPAAAAPARTRAASASAAGQSGSAR